MNERATAVIADDEPLLLHHLNKALAEVWPELEIVCQARNGQQAWEAACQYQPDVMFLDIRMPELDGMGVARKVLQLGSPPLVVFTTAYSDYAVGAFEHDVVDYVLKPVSEARLEKTCDKLRSQLRMRRSADVPAGVNTLLDELSRLSAPNPCQYLKWVKAAKGEDIHLLAVGDIRYFKAEDKYVSVFVGKAGGPVEEYVIRTPLKELLEQIDPQQFWQIHRSTLVNVEAIEKVSKDFTGRMSVRVNGTKLPVSRRAQSLFKGM